MFCKIYVEIFQKTIDMPKFSDTIALESCKNVYANLEVNHEQTSENGKRLGKRFAGI